MSQVVVKTHYSAAELAAMKLSGLPGTIRGVQFLAERATWDSVEVTGRGGLRREYAPPSAVMDAIRQRAAQQLAATMPLPALPVVQVQSTVAHTEVQRLTADARKGVLDALNALMARSGYPLKRAARYLIDSARNGDASPQLVAMLKLARDGRGRSSDDGLPSERSLTRFVEYHKTGALAPKKRESDMSVPDWAKSFLSFYQKPEKPTVEHAYQLFVEANAAMDRPSIHKVRRFLKKIGNVSLQVGRMGDRELKNLKPFVRRTFNDLLPSDVYSADGHKFDAEVQHPLHGRPFRPEITTVIDIATRRAVGWSIGLNESALVVLDALRHAVEIGGIPAIFYVDNGSGYVNQMMQDKATGLMARLGTEMVHSLPYNSQARGVIERFHQTLTKAAKEITGYMGADMDREAKHNVFKLSRNALKAKTKGEVATIPLMGWTHFIEFINGIFNAYNNRPHSSLPKMLDPENGRKRHQSPNEAWALAEAKGFTPHHVSKEEGIALFRPQMMRTIRRAEVELFGMRYSNAALTEFNGEQMAVSYDIHDPQTVWIYNADGRLICSAELNANAAPYMPKSVVQQAQEKRTAGREKRLLNGLTEIHAERDGALALEVSQGVVIPTNIDQIREKWALNQDLEILVSAPSVAYTEFTEVKAAVEDSKVADLPEQPHQRFARWMALDQLLNEGGVIENAKQTQWYGMYQQSNEFKMFFKRHQAMTQEEQSTAATVLCMNQN
ncbi:Mu transposase C-terminal domain-containing protein [Undibacterium sp. SXout11W]|uniref:Mu transposase C-terminal domain-containing protein n=1 Tax=Undibacterium sp. SXout11W TaxID=3413050 RepID=UPI003BF258AF